MHSKFFKLLGITGISLACLLMMAPIPAWGETLEVRISSDEDDAKQDEAPMYFHNDDLDLGDGDEEVGLRFLGVTVPKGSTIDYAYVEFTAHETVDRTVRIDISGEDVGNAPPFHLVSRHPDKTTGKG